MAVDNKEFEETIQSTKDKNCAPTLTWKYAQDFEQVLATYLDYKACGFAFNVDLNPLIQTLLKQAKGTLFGKGDPDAQRKLGRLYDEGLGVPKDETQAFEWYQRAAEHGNASAQNHLGMRYASGKGVSKNKKSAVKWYQRAAEQGFTGGQINLAHMYQTGQGVAKNEKLACEWYRRAAELGDVFGTMSLEDMASHGVVDARETLKALASKHVLAPSKNNLNNPSALLSVAVSPATVITAPESAPVLLAPNGTPVIQEEYKLSEEMYAIAYQTELGASAGAGAGPGPDITTRAVTPSQMDFIKALQASGINPQSLQQLQQQAEQTPFTAEEFQSYQAWKTEISKHISTVETQLMETQRKLGHDAKTLAEQAHIDSRPKLKAYQRRMEMELSSFATCYFLAPVGILSLADNKKDLMIAAINHIPKTVIAGIPLVGPLLSSGLGGVEAGMHFSNKKYRLNQMNRVKRLFRNPIHIAEIACRLGFLLTFEKEQEIEAQVDVQYKGPAKIKEFYLSAKASLQKLVKDLPTSDKTGVKTTAAEELAILDCACVFQQILSGETVIVEHQDLVFQFISVVTGEPYRARDLPVAEIIPAAVASAPTEKMSIAAVTPIPKVGAGSGIETEISVSPQVSPVNVASADEVAELRRQLAEQRERNNAQEAKQKAQEEAFRKQQAVILAAEQERKAMVEKLAQLEKQLPKPIEAESGDQTFALAKPEAADAGATSQVHQILSDYAEQLCIVREELNAVKESNARLLQERDFRQARERREAGHTALTLQSDALREKDKPQVGAGAGFAANAVTPQRPRRVNGPADLV